MSKRIGIIIGLIAIIVAIMFAIYYLVNAIEQKENAKNDLSTLTSDNLAMMINQIYEKAEIETDGLQTNEIALSDTDLLLYQIGLTNAQEVSSVMLSMPMINVHPFTFALIQTTKGADIEKIKKDILDNSNPGKWVCVNPEKVVVTNSDTVICLIMATNEQISKLINAFAEITGNELGKSLEKSGNL